MGQIRRFVVIAVFAVIAAAIGSAAISASHDGIPAPIVWRDHVVDQGANGTH
jgi:hypothetical protein